MRGVAGFVFAASLCGQDIAPVGMVRGTMLECLLLSATSTNGSLSLRTPENKVYRFVFDSRTYIEREKRRVMAIRLRQGDPLEIVSDRGESPYLRYARIVHVLDDAPNVRFSSYMDRIKQYRSITEHIVPRGNMTFAGVIASVEGNVMTLRVRGGEQARVFLRPDTRILQSGAVVDSSALTLTGRVFVRGGRNLDHQIEAYQIVSGEILSPRIRY